MSYSLYLFNSMKKSIPLFLSALMTTALLAGCAKATNDPEKDPPVTSGPTYNEEFKWTAAGSSEVTADSCHYYTSFTTIYAFKNGNAKNIEINLSGLAAGTYSFSSLTGNSLTYVNGSSTFTSTAGTLTISSNADNRIAGTFSAALAGGTVSSISGHFTDVHKK